MADWSLLDFFHTKYSTTHSGYTTGIGASERRTTLSTLSINLVLKSCIIHVDDPNEATLTKKNVSRAL